MEIYLDNAATTALDPTVLEAMLPYLTRHYANPSSTHRSGREARVAIDTARRTVADLLGASPGEIFFTAGATESTNIALPGIIRANSLRHIISSPIEHKAVIETIKEQERRNGSQVHWARLDVMGRLDWDYLERMLAHYPHALVSLMHGNNELGNLTDIDSVGWLCREHNAVFHSDTVQTMGRFRFKLSQQPIDFLVGSAHKFHGPKGVGFLYIRGPQPLPRLLQGGQQEQGLRPGTENVAGIVGLAKALEISYRDLETTRTHLQSLKDILVRELTQTGLDLIFNGTGHLPSESIPTVLNVSLPALPTDASLVVQLDKRGIAVSGGSACSNLSKAGSHVLNAIASYPNRENIRLSLSKYTTEADIRQFILAINQIYAGGAILAYAGVN